MENNIEDCKLGFFQNASFAGDVQDSTSTSGGLLCVFGSHTFVLVLSMCKKQTAVSHSSGLRMNGLPALEYGEFAVETLSCKPGATVGVTDAKNSCRIHIWIIVYLSQLTKFHPTFPKAHIQFNTTYSKIMRRSSK